MTAALEEATAAAAAPDRPLAALAHALEAAVDRARAEGVDVAAAEARLAALRAHQQQVDRTIAQVPLPRLDMLIHPCTCSHPGTPTAPFFSHCAGAPLPRLEEGRPPRPDTSAPPSCPTAQVRLTSHPDAARFV